MLKTCTADSVTFSGRFNNDTPKKFIIIIGAPNSGKGTTARALSEHFSLPYISGGDILRNKIKKGKNFNNIAKQFMEKLGPIPKYTQLARYYIFSTIKEMLKLPAYKNGAVIEGFPRNVEEADMLKSLIDKENNTKVQVVHLDVASSLLYKRSENRFMCKECNKTYSLKNINDLPKCECGGRLVKRSDDDPEILGRRLQKYEKETLPLVDYYGDRVISIQVKDSNTKAEEVVGKIMSKISE